MAEPKESGWPRTRGELERLPEIGISFPLDSSAAEPIVLPVMPVFQPLVVGEADALTWRDEQGRGWRAIQTSNGRWWKQRCLMPAERKLVDSQQDTAEGWR